MTAAVVTRTHPVPPPNFWRRRLLLPIIAQLQQGMTPRKIALTIALGALLGVFPILGTTTLLCTLAAIVLRLNQPIIQGVNFLVYPLQLALLIPFYRTGEYLLRRNPVPLDISMLLTRFHADAGQFFRDFGMIGVGGVIVWLLAAPLPGVMIFAIVHPLLHRLARGSGRLPVHHNVSH